MSDKLPFENSAEPEIADDRLTKTELEVNWESHKAGVEARVAMANKPDVDVRSLVRSAVAGKEIGGVYVPGLDGTILMLTQEVTDLLEKEEWKWLGGYGYQLAVMPWLCLFPDEAFGCFDRNDPEFAKEAIRSLAKKVSPKDQKEFNAWANERMSELVDKEEEEAPEKKPQGPRSQKSKKATRAK